MRRRWWVALSVAVTVVTTAAIMLAGDFYRGPSLLAEQIAMIALPIATPLFLAATRRRGTAWLWTIAAVVLASGWSYVVYAAAHPPPNGDASFAVLIGWAASVVAIGTTLAGMAIGLVIARSRRTG